MFSTSDVLQIIRTLGPRWLLFRLFHAAKKRCGWFSWRLPCRGWDQCRQNAFADFTAPEFPECSGSKWVIAQADNILGGETCYFFRHWFRTGFPPDWFANPFVNEQPEIDRRHWSLLSDCGDVDIKIVWEPSRFALVFPLARAYAATGSYKYARGFWQAVEDWREKNPPQCGANWMCGQEIALRLIAWVFGYGIFRNSSETTVARQALLAQMIGVSAERIRLNIAYALSQKNNHGISEAAGLLTAGIVLGQRKWVDDGRKLLEILAKELIYEDGSFSQHSTNYHRVMLHDYRWSIALAEANNAALSDELRRRIRAAEEWLNVMRDEYSGRVPNLGSNDGALVLPLTDAEYLVYATANSE